MLDFSSSSKWSYTQSYPVSVMLALLALVAKGVATTDTPAVAPIDTSPSRKGVSRTDTLAISTSPKPSKRPV